MLGALNQKAKKELGGYALWCGFHVYCRGVFFQCRFWMIMRGGTIIPLKYQVAQQDKASRNQHSDSITY